MKFRKKEKTKDVQGHGLSGGSGFLSFCSHQVECAPSFEPSNLAFIERVSQWEGL